MSFPSSLDISRNIARGMRTVRTFGRNVAVSSTFVPVARGGNYRTPQVGSVTALRIKAGGNADDTATGTGARAVTLVGLNAAGDVITETLATAGASASAPTTQTFLRLTDAFVSASGTYATQSAGSHAAAITIENAAGVTDWAVLADTDIARADAEVGVYTVPRERALYITNAQLQVDASNKSNAIMFRRSGILQTAAPYDAMLLIEEFPEVSGAIDFTYNPPLRIPELTDVGFMAKSSSGTISVSVMFEAIEVIE